MNNETLNNGYEISAINLIYKDKNILDYIKEINKYKNLTPEEEQNLAMKAKEGSIEAKQELIKSNLKLVVVIAKKIIHTSKLPMTDLIQEGNIGLMAAVDKFNWKFGYRFATYASWWIRQAMFKAISEQSNSVKIPVYIQETLSKYSKIKSEMERENPTDVNVEDVAKKMNIDVNKINNYLNAYKKTLSLEGDYEINNGSEVQLADIIEDKKANVQKDIEYESLKHEIVNLLSNLKDKEQKVITLRFGLEGKEKQTLEDIGKIFGVTKECIRQTEARALNKLRNCDTSISLYRDYLI
ncbi:MAG: RNA polymerase sigma factor RpoD/SigA [Candidatus Gastranaerophilales bacterium]|nr:RNA polymerase sigma factor RpoD/SigA [Candidatus Gastranaerophilales bacterium]